MQTKTHYEQFQKEAQYLIEEFKTEANRRRLEPDKHSNDHLIIDSSDFKLIIYTEPKNPAGHAIFLTLGKYADGHRIENSTSPVERRRYIIDKNPIGEYGWSEESEFNQDMEKAKMISSTELVNMWLDKML